MKKLILWLLYIVSIVFILSGSVNNGLSRYLMAIPFMAIMVWVSKCKFKENILFYFSIFLILFCIIVNHTQTKNPILYPIIYKGHIKILKDGYHVETYDGGGRFSSDKTRLGNEAKFTELKKGDIYNVVGVKINNPGFGTNIILITDIGQFNVYDYDSKYLLRNIETNKNVQPVWVEKLGSLMSWPAVPMLTLSYLINS